jgi:hypothetical protein
VINSTVIIRLSSPGKDVTESSVEESSNDCKCKNVPHEFVQFYTHCIVGKRLTPLVIMGKASVLTLGQRGPDVRQEVPMSTPKPFAQFIAICTFHRIMWWSPDALRDPLVIVQFHPHLRSSIATTI